MSCCVAVNGMSGCDLASHKICKNNAITMTVYKVPEVNILVKIEKINIMMFFFLFVTFLSDSVVSPPEKPNILEIRYIAVQLSCIYLSLSCPVVRSASRHRREVDVFARASTASH